MTLLHKLLFALALLRALFGRPNGRPKPQRASRYKVWGFIAPAGTLLPLLPFGDEWPDPWVKV